MHNAWTRKMKHSFYYLHLCFIVTCQNVFFEKGLKDITKVIIVQAHECKLLRQFS